MSKTFTLGEAQTLLPVLEALLRKAQTAAARARELDAEMQELTQRIFLSGGMHVNVSHTARRRAEREKAVQEAQSTIAEMEAIGVLVSDMENGLLEFPSVMDGQAVLLSWKMGEKEIAHWYTSEEGIEGRKPLDARFGKSEPGRLN